MNYGYALDRAELVRAVTAYSGWATADGAVTKNTIVDANLIGKNDFISKKTILIMSGDAAYEDKGAASFNPVTGTITLQSGFSAQIKAGTLYRILNISTAEIDVANIDTKIGTNTDPAGTTTLFAWLAKLFAGIGQGQGLAYYGKVNSVPGANQFTIDGLAGLGAGKFIAGAFAWEAFVFRDAGGAGAAPQGEMQPITAYVTASGTFTAPGFGGGGIAVDDEILLLHPRLAQILRLQEVPAADAVLNIYLRDVIGQKGDTSDYTATATQSSLMRLLKGLLGITVIAEGTFTTSSATVPADTGRTEGNDFFKGCVLMPVAGAIAFQPRPIRQFTSGADVFTLDEPFTAAPGLVAYVILASDYPVQRLMNMVGATGIFHEQADVAVNVNATNAAETDVLNLAAANTRYIVRSLRLKCADPGANTVTVRLYELVNDVLTEVDAFAITAANFGTYHSLMDMFGLPHLAGDRLQVTVRASAGGPYAVTGQYSHGRTNV